MLVVGDKEVDSNAVSVRLRTGENLGPRPVAEFTAMATRLAQERSLELTEAAVPVGV